MRHRHADPTHPIRLLRAPCERPCCRSRNSSDEIIEHWIIACAAFADGDDSAKALAAQFPGLMEEYENWPEPD
jgi:hypothetical protein